MTQQQSDQVSIDGEKGWIRRAEPLSAMIRRRGIPLSGKGNTAVQRGYTAEWAVQDDRLWLVAILDPDDDVWPAAIAHIFGSVRPPILATWYSGRFVVELGEPVGSSLWGPISSTVESEVLVKEGIVTMKRRYKPTPWTLVWRGALSWSVPVLTFVLAGILLVQGRC
ncbi:MAG: hypothetical protein R3B09_08745 [Nannocystaceae bacterium]